MKLQRISALSSKSLKTIIRQPASLFMTILFPLVLTLVFGASFGGIGGGQETTFKMGVVNLDLGGPYSHWSTEFIGNMSQTKILDVKAYPDNATGQHDLSEGSIQGLILIPDNFGESCNSFWRDPGNPSVWTNATVELYVDSASMLAVQAVPPVVQDVLATAVYGRQTSVPRPVQLGMPSLVEAKKFTTYDYFVPGLFAFAAIFLIMIVAQSFTLDRKNGLLRRIATTPTTPSEVIGSEALTYMVVAVVQVGVVFAMAFIMGFRPAAGNPLNILMAFVLVLIFALCSVGFGLISASLAKDLPYMASKAAAFGLDRREALKGVTIYPAQIFGVDNMMGSLEKGKRANIVIADGDILELRTNIKFVFIDGLEADLFTRYEELLEKFKKRF